MNSSIGQNPTKLPGEPSPFRRGKLAVGAAGFVLLTSGVFWYQFSLVSPGAAAPSWNDLRWGYLALILLCLPVETATCGLRTWVMTRVLQPSVSLWSCIKASGPTWRSRPSRRLSRGEAQDRSTSLAAGERGPRNVVDDHAAVLHGDPGCAPRLSPLLVSWLTLTARGRCS